MNKRILRLYKFDGFLYLSYIFISELHKQDCPCIILCSSKKIRNRTPTPIFSRSINYHFVDRFNCRWMKLSKLGSTVQRIVERIKTKENEFLLAREINTLQQCRSCDAECSFGATQEPIHIECLSIPRHRQVVPRSKAWKRRPKLCKGWSCSITSIFYRFD